MTEVYLKSVNKHSGAPKQFHIYGSTDDVVYTKLKMVDLEDEAVDDVSGTLIELDLEDVSATYSYLALIITKVSTAGSETNVMLSSLQFRSKRKAASEFFHGNFTKGEYISWSNTTLQLSLFCGLPGSVTEDHQLPGGDESDDDDDATGEGTGTGFGEDDDDSPPPHGHELCEGDLHFDFRIKPFLVFEDNTFTLTLIKLMPGLSHASPSQMYYDRNNLVVSGENQFAIFIEEYFSSFEQTAVEIPQQFHSHVRLQNLSNEFPFAGDTEASVSMFNDVFLPIVGYQQDNQGRNVYIIVEVSPEMAANFSGNVQMMTDIYL